MKALEQYTDTEGTLWLRVWRRIRPGMMQAQWCKRPGKSRQYRRDIARVWVAMRQTLRAFQLAGNHNGAANVRHSKRQLQIMWSKVHPLFGGAS